MIDPLSIDNPPLASYQTMYFLFKGNPNNAELSLLSCNEFMSNDCMIVRGEFHYTATKESESIEDYAYRILKNNPLTLLLANTASHPQYSGKKLEALRTNPFQNL